MNARRTSSRPRLLCVAPAILLLVIAGWGSLASAQEAEPVPAKAAGGAWNPQGPGPALNAQPENIPNSPVSGAVETVVAHPANPDVVWIGAVNGGVFRTDDATAADPRWKRLTDAQVSLSIAALELDPTDVGFNTLVAGIGRTSSLANLGGARTGLLRTTDGGDSWTVLSSLAGKDVTGVAPRGSVIVVSTNRADITPTACSDTGIYRSTNTGSSFSSVSSGSFCGFSYDLAGNPLDSSQLFTDHTRGTVDGIFRSDDTGASWTKVSNAAMDTLLGSTYRVEIAVGRAGAGASANVYVAICDTSQLAGLYRSGNAGATWTSLDLPSTTEMGTSYGIHPGGQCSIHLSLVADPTNHDVVYIGGDRQPANNENGMPGAQFPNSINASNYGGRLFRVDASQTPGSQATPITNCPTATAACGGAVRTVSDSAPHADSREMVFDANGDLLETDDGGIYRHTDPGGSSGDWVSVIGNLPVTEQHDSAYDSVSNVIVSGNQDNGTTSQFLPNDVTWDAVYSGDGGDVAVGQNDPAAGQSTRYMSAQNLGGLVRLVYDSNNAFQSFAFPTLTPIGASAAVSPQFVTPIEVNAVTPSRVLLGAASGLYESFDRLDSVNQILPGFAVNILGGGSPMAYGAANDANAIYFLYFDTVISYTGAFGGFYQSDPNAGSTENLASVVVDPGTAATAFVVDSDQVFRSTNGGSSQPWTEITGNLQSLSPGTLHSVEYVPSVSGDGLVVGADNGVFVALAGTGFTTWDRLASLPNAPVFELDYDAADDVLAAGTLGRGAWKLDSASLQIHNLCNETLSLVTGVWKQISLACNPGASNTVADVFGDDLSGTYDVDWVVWRHDAATQTNVKMATTDALSVGKGYWIKTLNAAQSVDVGTTVNAVTEVAPTTSTADPSAGCASSAGRCDMMGHPGTYEACWADVEVIDGASTLSLSAADPSGACQAAGAAGNGCVMSRIAHKWTGASYAPFDGETLGMEGTLVPWDGFWISAVKSGVKLRIPKTGGNCGAPEATASNGWYVRLVAESGALRDATNVLGQLSDSNVGYDSHDLQELEPFDSPFLTVVFPHDGWGEKAGDYASDYHALRPESEPDEWSFEVRSSDPGAEVTLRWEGPGSRVARSVLIDQATGQRIEVQAGGSYTFVLNGNSRSFGWVMQDTGLFSDGFESGTTSAWSSAVGE